ncbi:MAG: LysM peptidoglycan-binding domain-containing protein [Deltaproteobacteria bacterium]|nr:LysM peptidoglycan-binding domain-containing protein [Deltaproteobacteria bacterium]
MRAGRTYRELFGITVFALLVTISVTVPAAEFATPEVSTTAARSAVPLPQQDQPLYVPLNLTPEQVPEIRVSTAATPSAVQLPQQVRPPFVPSGSFSGPVAVPAASPEEKQKDRVLSPGEVDLQLSRNAEEERGADASKDFFVSVQADAGEKDTDLYDGLMVRIEKFIRYFQTRGKDRFETYLTRSGKYGDMMRGILAKYGLPGDLIYLALIESGFSPKAYSIARAAGPWQFIAGTGRRYGLRIDWWTDERRDYEKSTHAAASYLRDLYGMFDSWPLAAAAYNAGEGKIQKAVARYKSEDYVELSRHRYLKQETKDYVPKMIAALTIAKEPEKYGFEGVKYEDPLEFDKVSVPGGTGMKALGRIIGVPYESLREWNPELRRFCTPPNQEVYEIRLPKGYGRVALERMEQIRTDARVTFVRHTVKKGETLAFLAEKYQTTVPVLQELNGLKKPRVSRSAGLILPVIGLSAEEAVPGKEISPEQVETAVRRLDDGTRRTGTVLVRKGDTLSAIAKRTGVSVDGLAGANGLDAKKHVIRAGSRLRLPGTGAAPPRKSVTSAGDGKKEIRHIVRRGDTLTKISRTHGVTVDRLSERNNLKGGRVLPQGRVLFIPQES